MSARRGALAQRRRDLLARSQAQRAALVASAAPFVRKAEVFDRLLGHVQRHPLLAGAVTAVCALFGSRRLFDVAARGARLYFLLRR